MFFKIVGTDQSGNRKTLVVETNDKEAALKKAKGLTNVELELVSVFEYESWQQHSASSPDRVTKEKRNENQQKQSTKKASFGPVFGCLILVSGFFGLVVMCSGAGSTSNPPYMSPDEKAASEVFQRNNGATKEQGDAAARKLKQMLDRDKARRR